MQTSPGSEPQLVPRFGLGQQILHLVPGYHEAVAAPANQGRAADREDLEVTALDSIAQRGPLEPQYVDDAVGHRSKRASEVSPAVDAGTEEGDSTEHIDLDAIGHGTSQLPGDETPPYSDSSDLRRYCFHNV